MSRNNAIIFRHAVFLKNMIILKKDSGSHVELEEIKIEESQIEELYP